MIEIVCPSCGARYQVPDDSIGPAGRKVTCSSCSHKWRAYPPAAAAAEAQEAEWELGSAAETAESGAEAPARSPADSTAASAGYAAEPEDGTAAAASASGGGREEQMDTIRRMLDDLKRNAETEPEPEPEPEPERRPASPPSSARRREETVELDDDSGGDPLKSRINRLEGGAAKEAKPSNYDAARLRKMHERRAKRLQRAKARKRKSGAFMTGFTLVTAVAGVMVGLYVLRPQIIEASPEMAPAMNEYVVTVDRYRTVLDDATADWRTWVVERVGQLTAGEEEQAGGQGGAPAGDQPGAAVEEQEPAAAE